MPELVEIVQIGAGPCALSHRRAWSDGRLVGDSVSDRVDIDRVADGETILVETFFGSEEEEALSFQVV